MSIHISMSSYNFCMYYHGDRGNKKNKNNTLTDGYIPSSGKSILPDKLINALYWKLEREGVEFKMTMVELRSLLSLKHGKDDERIYKAIEILQTPIEIRDFNFEQSIICNPLP